MKEGALLLSVRKACAGVWLAMLSMVALHAQTPSLDVLHWWTSAGERRAADQLRTQLLGVGVLWNDAAIPGP